MKAYNFQKQTIFFRNIAQVLNFGLEPLVIGFERCSPSKGRLCLQKKHTVLHFVLQGKGTVEIEKKRYPVTENMIFFLPPERKVAYWPDKKDPWQYVWIEVAGSQCSHAIGLAGLHPDSIPFAPTRAKQIRTLFSDMVEESFETRPGVSMGILGKFLQILDLLSYDADYNAGDMTTAPDTGRRASVQTAIDLLERNYYDPTMSVSRLSKQLNFSAPYLSKIFKETMGVPPTQYLTNIRMRHACELLASHSYSVSEIAQAVGYNSPYYFSNEFKHIYGMSPSRYKAECAPL